MLARNREPRQIPHSAENLFGEIEGNRAFTEISNRLTSYYGIDTETACAGVEWGTAWWRALEASDSISKLTKSNLLALREEVAETIPLPLDDTDGRPTFRARYAAEQTLYQLARRQGPSLRKKITGTNVHIVPSFERIDAVLGTLLDTYRQSKFPYSLDSTRVPQDPRHMPRNLNLDPETRTPEESLQVAQFWFADCYYMRGVNDSNAMTVNLALLHEDHPEIFSFTNAASMDPREIETLLLDYHLAVQHKQTSEHWVENAKRMAERYNGNPIQLFEGSPTYDELVDRIRNDKKGGGFKGFQKKMVSMLSYFYMVSDLVPYRNYPLPVDFHVIRISVSNELVRFRNLPKNGQIPFEATTDFLRDVFYDFADRHDISQLEMCDAVWLFSRELCSLSPGNTMRQIGAYAARGTQLEPTLTSYEEATPKQREQYAKSCGQCPIVDTCRHNVPSARYYKHGIVTLPDPKIHFPIYETMFDQNSVDCYPSHVTTEHAIDKITRQRNETARSREAFLRHLAHPVIDDVFCSREKRTSKPFTRTEVMSALKDYASEEIARVFDQITVIER